MTQKDPSGEAIEALDGEELLNLIRESESLAVYFYIDNCEQCTGINILLNKIVSKRKITDLFTFRITK